MNYLLPTLLLVAAGAAAQTAPVVPAAKPGEIGRIALGFADSGDFDGYQLGVSAAITKDIFIEARFADVSGATATDDFRAYHFSAGYRLAFGAGKASAALGLGSLDGDEINGDQVQARLAYSIEIAPNLQAELSLTHSFNDLDASAPNADDVTAPALTLRYTVSKGLGVELSVSSEDTLSYTDTGDGTWSVGAVYAF